MCRIVCILENTRSQTEGTENADANVTIDTVRQMRDIEEPMRHSQLVSLNTSESVNNDISMETESSQIDQVQTASAGSTYSHGRTEHDNVWDESSTMDEMSTNMANKQENMMENLQDRLTTMRDGFLER